MKFKLLHDIEIAGVIHKTGEVFIADGINHVRDNFFWLCFGHGSYFPLEIDKDCVEQ